MRAIKLTRGLITFVSDSDFRLVRQWKWYAQSNNCGKFYAARTDSEHRVVLLHRFLKSDSNSEIDHRNGDSLDNRRKNLRLATVMQNRANSKKRKDGITSRFKGVCRCQNKWRAYITHKGKRTHLGVFSCEISAARMYNRAALRTWGRFARLNKLEKLKN